MFLTSDYHTHTVFSHGKGKIIDNAIETENKAKNVREAGTGMKNKGSAAVSGAKSNRKLTISVDLNPTTV